MKNQSVVAVFHNHSAAERAVKGLERAGIDLKKISIVGKDYHTEEHVTGYYNNGDRMKYWGKTGAFWGGLWGLLFGSAFFFVPGLGPLAMGGPVVSWFVGALEGAVVVGGLSALGAALYGAGIPKDSVLRYETALRSDRFLVLVHGSAEETEKAREVLDGFDAVEVEAHEAVTAE